MEVTAKDAQGSSLAANNGLTMVTYDASALELKDVRISGDYTARLTAAGAVTFGYIAAAALEAGAPVATLTFAVKEGNTQNTYITVTHKEANGEKPGYVEQLPWSLPTPIRSSATKKLPPARSPATPEIPIARTAAC